MWKYTIRTLLNYTKNLLELMIEIEIFDLEEH